jgi:hypothetical protein
LTAAGPAAGVARAATEDDLAYANFGAATELLVRDFYVRALEAKVVSGPRVAALRRGRAAAAGHARALSDLLVGAGDAAPVEEDFEFAWPERTFETERAVVETGTGVLRALLGAYQTASASLTEPPHRVLYASLAASVSRQIAAIAGAAAAATVEPFPVALDLESASTALEAYLG